MTLCVHDMVSARAASQPDAPALSSRHGELTYSEMNRRANTLAKYFQSIGIGPNTVVALWLRRSPWVVVTALAALKAGAAYLPLDPENPTDRLLFMVHDCGAAVVITESALAERTHGARCRVIVVDHICDTIAQYDPGDAPPIKVELQDLAYVIYTSGSTGLPKGVEITHANLANLISWHNRAFSVGKSDRATHLAGLGFDASVWETWPYLAAGASLCMAEYHTLINPENLRDWMLDNEITIGFVPTPIAERLLGLEWPAETKLRTLLTGGDALHLYPSPNLPFTLVNNYGPTECTVVAISGVVPSAPTDSLPALGVPIDNTQVYILDERMQPVSEGQAGELFIGGANVGRGYCNHPELTDERFVASPLMPETRLYRTGDLGCYLPDGKIAFLGRTDNQVKLRGYRIELDEIAAALNTHPAVSVSAAALRDDDGKEKQLLAYIVAQSDPSPRDLQEFLLERLPGYMVPSAFVRLDNLPLTANGKVDRAALPAPAADNMLMERTLVPSSAVEIRLAGVIAGLLKIPEVGLDDDFFLLGGHSLLGTQLIGRIRETFNVEVPLRALFERPSVRELAEEIEQLSSSNSGVQAA